MSSEWGDFKTPCPNCGGVVHYWVFGSDCRGNPESSGIECRKCNRKFTRAEWEIIACEEIQETRRVRALSDAVHSLRSINQTIVGRSEIAQQLEEKLQSKKPLREWGDQELQLFFMKCEDFVRAWRQFEEHQ